jgi:hypothetical protein
MTAHLSAMLSSDVKFSAVWMIFAPSAPRMRPAALGLLFRPGNLLQNTSVRYTELHWQGATDLFFKFAYVYFYFV